MEIIKGSAEEIAALVLAVQERQAEDPFAVMAEKLHRALRRQAKEAPLSPESQ